MWYHEKSVYWLKWHFLKPGENILRTVCLRSFPQDNNLFPQVDTLNSTINRECFLVTSIWYDSSFSSALQEKHCWSTQVASFSNTCKGVNPDGTVKKYKRLYFASPLSVECSFLTLPFKWYHNHSEGWSFRSALEKNFLPSTPVPPIPVWACRGGDFYWSLRDKDRSNPTANATLLEKYRGTQRAEEGERQEGVHHLVGGGSPCQTLPSGVTLSSCRLSPPGLDVCREQASPFCLSRQPQL